ncbi:MAG: hypothetical protein M1508_01060 [Nitrospirae bacterium]|nr:hypothetical protein [Nitrospirota bacterium]MCL5420890.1 hypothetical protein [Nitrospirota bacterium]
MNKCGEPGEQGNKPGEKGRECEYVGYFFCVFVKRFSCPEFATHSSQGVLNLLAMGVRIRYNILPTKG